MKKEALRVSTTIPVAPTTLYLAWLSSEQHTAMTGGTAKVDGVVGGKFTGWNGYISGQLVTLDLGRRIVMSWRTTDFPREAPDSRVEIHFEALGGGTRLTILHTDIPEGQGEKYRTGWNDNYFSPMRTFFSKYLPDPRKPPPPRRPIPPPDDEEEEEAPKKGKGKAPLPGKAVASKEKPAGSVKVAPSKPAKAAPKPAPKRSEPAPAPRVNQVRTPSKKPAAKPAPKPAAKKPAAKPAAAKKSAKPGPKTKAKKK